MFIRRVILGCGGDPRLTIRALRRNRWRVGLLYVIDLARDLQHQFRRCGQELACIGSWNWYYRRWFLMLVAYMCLVRLLLAGLQFRLGLGDMNREAVVSIVARALEAPRALAAL